MSQPGNLGERRPYPEEYLRAIQEQEDVSRAIEEVGGYSIERYAAYTDESRPIPEPMAGTLLSVMLDRCNRLRNNKVEGFGPVVRVILHVELSGETKTGDQLLKLLGIDPKDVR